MYKLNFFQIFQYISNLLVKMQVTQQEIITDEDSDSDGESEHKKKNQEIPVVTKSFEYETKKGMLKYLVEISETTSEDDGITIRMIYESYEDGIAYETIYEPDNIPYIHKLFALDPTMILDIISDNSLIMSIKNNSKVVSVHYKTKFMKRTYDITMACLRVTHEGQDPAMGDLQRQNKVLLRQVSKLTNRLDYMEKQFEKLSMCVAKIELSEVTYRKPAMLTDLCDLIDINKVERDATNSYVWNTFYACKGDFDTNFKVQTLMKGHLNLNIYDAKKNSLLGMIITNIGYSHDLTKYIEAMVKHGVDVNYRNPEGKTPLIICEERMITYKVTAAYVQNLNKIKTVLLHSGAK
jgi:hypothetical protein